MHSKLLLFIFLLNLSFPQALLNRAIGGEQSFGSAKSFSMGFTHSLNTNNSAIIKYNPSLLLYNSMGSSILFDIQINSELLKERRSILVKDYFGDFLTYADYLNNDNMYNYFQGGFQTHINNIGFGMSLLPLASFNYDYIEEIRGRASIEDGDVGFKDPIVGYHIFKTSGRLNNLSLGSSYTLSNSVADFNIGLGYHYIFNTEIKDDIHIDTLTTQIQNLSLVNNYISDQTFKDIGNYFTIGFSTITNDMLVSLVFESDLLIEQSLEPFNFIDSVGVISYLDDSQTNFILRGLHHYKPQKFIFGINYSSKNNKDLTVSLEIEKIINEKNLIYLKDHSIFKLGFEYLLPNATPIRTGIVYKTSPVTLIPDQAIFTFGTGGSFKNIIYDLGMSYSTFDYFYPDLFSVEEDQLIGFDKINETNLSTIFTIGYKF